MTADQLRPAPAGDGHAPDPADRPLVVSLETLNRSALALAGGKGANLGELLRAGLPVPPGFCVTTHAYELAAAGAGLARLPGASDGPRTAAESAPDLAAQARQQLLASPIPDAIVAAIREAYAALGNG